MRVNKEACGDQFKDLSWALDRTDDLEPALKNLYGDLNIPVKLSDIGISEDSLPKIAFETSTNTVNLAANPEHVTEKRILGLLKNFY